MLGTYSKKKQAHKALAEGRLWRERTIIHFDMLGMREGTPSGWKCLADVQRVAQDRVIRAFVN
jgi:hypothetical protein